MCEDHSLEVIFPGIFLSFGVNLTVKTAMFTFFTERSPFGYAYHLVFTEVEKWYLCDFNFGAVKKEKMYQYGRERKKGEGRLRERGIEGQWIVLAKKTDKLTNDGHWHVLQIRLDIIKKTKTKTKKTVTKWKKHAHIVGPI